MNIRTIVKIRLRNQLSEIENRLDKLSRAPMYSLSKEKQRILYKLADITIEARDYDIPNFRNRVDDLKRRCWKLMGL